MYEADAVWQPFWQPSAAKAGRRLPGGVGGAPQLDRLLAVGAHPGGDALWAASQDLRLLSRPSAGGPEPAAWERVRDAVGVVGLVVGAGGGGEVLVACEDRMLWSWDPAAGARSPWLSRGAAPRPVGSLAAGVLTIASHR